MSHTLQETIAEKKQWPAPVIQCVEKDYRPVNMITFCPWQENVWILPWSRLDAMRLVDKDSLERVELFFPHHQVIAVGENLRQILDGLRTHEVCCLRSMPATHRACLKPSAAFIARLEVLLLADPKNHPAEGIPCR